MRVLCVCGCVSRVYRWWFPETSPPFKNKPFFQVITPNAIPGINMAMQPAVISPPFVSVRHEQDQELRGLQERPGPLETTSRVVRQSMTYTF